MRGCTGCKVHGRAEVLCLRGSGMAKDRSLLPALPQHWFRDAECSVMSKAANRSRARPLRAGFPMPRFKGAGGWEGKQRESGAGGG